MIDLNKDMKLKRKSIYLILIAFMLLSFGGYLYFVRIYADSSEIAAIKTVDKTTANVGEKMTYNLSVENTSAQNLTNIKFNDLVPTNATIIPTSINQNGTLTNNIVEWTIGQLMAGEKFTANFSVQAGGPALNKKIIEFGQDSPLPSFVKANLNSMEQKPFNGVTMNLSMYSVIRPTKLVGPEAPNQNMSSQIISEANALSSINWGQKLTDNFLIMMTCNNNPDFDWFDDTQWANSMNNVAYFAKAAKDGYLKGLVIDPEQYYINMWDYSIQKQASTKNWEEYKSIVRTRGANFVNTIEANFENPELIFLLYKNWLRGATVTEISSSPIDINPNTEEGDAALKLWNNGLYNAFMEGVLDGINSGTKIYDGNENSYFLQNGFPNTYDNIMSNNIDFVDETNKSKYQQSVSAGEASFLNLHYKTTTLNSICGNLTSNMDKCFEWSIYHGLQYTSRYLWVWSENYKDQTGADNLTNWWTNTNIPEGAVGAIESAKSKILNNQSVGITFP